jgi:predicted dehydrogenase
MSEIPRPRVACFGAGWVTTHRHVPALRDHGGFEIAALVDPDGDRAERAAAALGIPHAVRADRLSATPWAGRVDAVTCGVPPTSHHLVARDAIESGAHVLVEKPLAMTVEEADDLARLGRDRGLAVAVMHNFLFARSTRRVRRWVAAGRLGALQGVWATQLSNPRRRVPAWADDLPLGLFFDESVNLLALADLLAPGELEPRAASIHPGGDGATPAQVDVQLRSSQGVPVALLMHFTAPVSEWHVTVLGERALAAIDVFRDIALLAPNDGRHGAREVLRTSLAISARHWLGHVPAAVGIGRGRWRYGVDHVVAAFWEAIVRRRPLPAGLTAADGVRLARLQTWVAEHAAG